MQASLQGLDRRAIGARDEDAPRAGPGVEQDRLHHVGLAAAAGATDDRDRSPGQRGIQGGSLQALERENEALRHLLDAAEKVQDKVLMAELIEVSLDPYTHKILVDRGLRDGTHIGQPVFDPTGVMGQVTQVMPFTSAVTLITDPGHAIPVQVRRNGLRAVAFGTGNSDRMRISYLSQVADIRVGDVLLSSGLGGRFPTGYPVAKVLSVENDPGEAFLHIEAQPTAKIDRSSQVLLVWRRENQSQITPDSEVQSDAEQELHAAILEEEAGRQQ